jgi:hypothetical protein
MLINPFKSIGYKFVNPHLDLHCCYRPGSAEGYDCIVALQAVRHIVAPPAHYAAKLKLPVAGGETTVQLG